MRVAPSEMYEGGEQVQETRFNTNQEACTTCGATTTRSLCPTCNTASACSNCGTCCSCCKSTTCGKCGAASTTGSCNTCGTCNTCGNQCTTSTECSYPICPVCVPQAPLQVQPGPVRFQPPPVEIQPPPVQVCPPPVTLQPPPLTIRPPRVIAQTKTTIPQVMTDCESEIYYTCLDQAGHEQHGTYRPGLSLSQALPAVVFGLTIVGLVAVLAIFLPAHLGIQIFSATTQIPQRVAEVNVDALMERRVVTPCISDPPPSDCLVSDWKKGQYDLGTVINYWCVSTTSYMVYATVECFPNRSWTVTGFNELLPCNCRVPWLPQIDDAELKRVERSLRAPKWKSDGKFNKSLPGKIIK